MKLKEQFTKNGSAVMQFGLRLKLIIFLHVCRFLKSCMWQAEKKTEMEQRMKVQALYCDLVKQYNLNKKVSLCGAGLSNGNDVKTGRTH